MAKKKKEKKTNNKSGEATLKQLLEAGCHFGHKKAKIHPNVKKYIYDIRDGIAIFDLTKTKELLDEAKDFVSDLTKKGGKIVFVGTKRQAREIIKEEASQIGVPYITNRWLGGTITNWKQIKENSIDKYNELKEEWDKGEYDDRSKKEQAMIRRELTRLRRIIGGIADLNERFDALFLVDAHAQETAVKEAKMRDVPIVAIVDSNTDPTDIDYPIPANDDAAKSIQLIVREIAKAVKEPSSSKKEEK
jgi:small subunit ribosomal protein S2